MAITDYKITDGEITQRNVKSAPDVLSDTPNNNKAVFDNLTEHFIGKYNDLIDNINSDFVDSNEFGEGITATDKVRWRYALTKGTSIGLNFSGNITQITTGFRTIVGDIDGLTENDFMDCYLSINGTDYECGDSYTSGNSILTSAVINGVTVDIIYDIANGNITLEHATNPLDTLYWNVSIYRSVAEKVPRKALPATVSNDGYTELLATGKWHGVELDKANALPVGDTTDAYIPVMRETTSNTAYLYPMATDVIVFKDKATSISITANNNKTISFGNMVNDISTALGISEQYLKDNYVIVGVPLITVGNQYNTVAIAEIYTKSLQGAYVRLKNLTSSAITVDTVEAFFTLKKKTFITEVSNL